MAVKKKRGRGRPPLPAAERSAARVTMRLLPHHLEVLAELRELLDLSDVEVLRLALAELAARRLR